MSGMIVDLSTTKVEQVEGGTEYRMEARYACRVAGGESEPRMNEWVR